jgi:hypothetical protein
LFNSVAVWESRGVFRLPVEVKVPNVGLYSSAPAKAPPLEPPAIRTAPLFNSVVVCPKRAVLRLSVKTKPAVTVNVVEPLIVPDAAVIVVLPGATAPATPCEPVALLIVAMPEADELHVAVLVRFCVLESL